MGHIKRKSAFEHVQNAQIQIILRMRKISSGHIYYTVQLFCSRTLEALIILRGRPGCSGPLLSACPKICVRMVRLVCLRICEMGILDSVCAIRTTSLWSLLIQTNF